MALAPADVMLSEVVVKPKKEKYSRKNNPAVEFMKKVIEHKKALFRRHVQFFSLGGIANEFHHPDVFTRSLRRPLDGLIDTNP